MKTVPLWKVLPTGIGSELDDEYVAVYTDEPLPGAVRFTHVHKLFDVEKGCELDRVYVCIKKAELAQAVHKDSAVHPCGACGAPYYDDGEPAFEDHRGVRQRFQLGAK